MRTSKIIYIFYVFLLASNLVISAAFERRAVIDIGSQGTKIAVADVDSDTRKLHDIVFYASQEVGYKDDITKQKDKSCFSKETIKKGIDAINSLKRQAQGLNPVPERYFAFATASLRAVPCAQDLVELIHEKTGIPTQIIAQEEEGRLAFEGSVAAAGIPRQDAVVWEIGGGSMQITTLDKSGRLISYGNNYGMIPFRNMLIAQVQHKNPQETTTLNPLSYNDAYRSEKLSELIAHAVPEEIKNKLAKPTTQVLGTGIINRIARIATHNPKATQVNLKALEQALYSEFTDKTDQETLKLSEEIKPDSIFVPITGLALLIGYMKALGIKNIKLVKSGISQGALVDPNYFN